MNKKDVLKLLTTKMLEVNADKYEIEMDTMTLTTFSRGRNNSIVLGSYKYNKETCQVDYVDYDVLYD